MKQVAILFARKDSIYKSIPGCDVWDAARDARLWPGGCPVVAHPPCRAWGQLRWMANIIQDEKDLAPWAVDQVRRWGGVLEHPKLSQLWPTCGLPKTGADAWGGWTLGIHQQAWGHRAQKATLLYVVGCQPRDVPIMPLVLGDAEAVCGGSRRRPEITHREREETPHSLAVWLVDLARSCG